VILTRRRRSAEVARRMKLLSVHTLEDKSKNLAGEKLRMKTRMDGVTGGGIYSATGRPESQGKQSRRTGEGMADDKKVPQWLYKKVPQWLYQLVWASFAQWRENCCRGYPL
jgi:hypothetical protein